MENHYKPPVNLNEQTMKKNYSKLSITFLIVLFLSLNIYAQEGKPFWNEISQKKALNQKQPFMEFQPTEAMYYQLDINGLKTTLQNAPKRNDLQNQVSNVIVNFPNNKGKLQSYRIKEASTMEPDLQAMFPEIRSYVGQGINNPSAIIRFSISPEKGLSSMVFSDKKTVFIEPYTNDLSSYMVYSRSSSDPRPEFVCETEYIDQQIPNDFNVTAARNANDGQLRTFRLALACTGEYAQFHGGTVPAVMAAMNTTMTRVNGIFERDLAVTMVMVDNTSIIFLNGLTDPYTNDNGGVMLGENQTTCDTNIGVGNYDIGHVFSTGGGGVAYLNSPCVNGNKAGGVTGGASPVGDAFDVDFVAHEMGHQYGGNHTQNNNCQRSAVSVEPGSASTIMGYAGICVPNVQNNSDDYFHGENIKEMWANITTGSSQCGTQSSTGNTAPVANAGANFTIPRSTPFVLRGSATDVDMGDSLTYCWEQTDATPATMPPVSTSTVGPAFRSLQPTTSPDRFMPAFGTVLAGSTSSTWEVVPSVARTMNFSLTVRDNVSGGASTASDNMVVTTSGPSGPFLVTSQATSGISWIQGTTETITWDVAGTTSNGVDEANVNILLSTDGGLNFDTVLASNVPNNGSYDITVPNIPSAYCRVMVEAVNNIFFNINSEDFALGFIVTTSCTQYSSAPNLNLSILDGTGAPVFNTINIPDSNTIDEIKVNVDISHSWISDLLVQIQHPNGTTFTSVWNGNCGSNDNFDIIFDDTAPAIVCANPTVGTYAPVNPLSVFDGLNSIGDWDIAIADFSAGDLGVLNDWGIEICTNTVTASIDEFGSNLFSIYPNPNRGEFTVKLNSLSSDEAININVSDIRGRLIFNNLYSNSSSFNQIINLNSVQSGMYLVTVSSGGQKTTKKVIVQ